MTKHTKREDVQYRKSMMLTSASLVVEVREKADYSHKDADGKQITNIDPAYVEIFHSPARFDSDRFKVHLKNRQELKDYIEMLVDFEATFGTLLDDVQTPTEMVSRQRSEI